jgi:hypothetical protein
MRYRQTPFFSLSAVAVSSHCLENVWRTLAVGNGIQEDEKGPGIFSQALDFAGSPCATLFITVLFLP